MAESNSVINSNSDKGSEDSNNNSTLLEISQELQKEKVVSEIKYTPAVDCLKITFSKKCYYETLYQKIDIKNWYIWKEELKETIRNKKILQNGYQYSLVENNILDNLELLLKAKENYSQSIQKNEQREEERKTSLLKKYVFEGKLLTSTVILEKNLKFITISKSTSLPSADSINNDITDDKSDWKTTDNVIIELFDEIESPAETENAIPAENQHASSSEV